MPRGSRPGERRGGRKAGTPNKSTAKRQVLLEDLVRDHVPDMLGVLVALATDASVPPAARVAAAKELLDRSLGKAPSSVSIGGPGGPGGTLIIEHVLIPSPQRHLPTLSRRDDDDA